jgi:hypothetical protein
VAAGRLKLHQIAGKDFTTADNNQLVNQAKALVEEELQGYRDVSIDPDGRLYINTKTNPVEESETQQIISLLMGAQAESEALQGRSMRPNLQISPEESKSRLVIQELIGRGLINPGAITDVASRGFRHPSRVSTDDLSEKLLEDIYQIGSGRDPETGAAFTLQDKQSGHKEDDNLRPELGHSIDNIAQQSRIVNQVTADSAKNRSSVSPKYKSIVDQRKKALELINSQYNKGYKDTVYTDDNDSDIYGSALDDLIKQTRSELIMDTNRKAGDVPILDAYRQAISGSTRADSPGANRERSLVIDSGGGDVTIEEGVLRSNGKNGNGKNGKH